LAGHDVIARLELPQYRNRDGGHPGRGRARGLGAFKGGPCAPRKLREAERRFRTRSRLPVFAFSNPTVAMFEARMAALNAPRPRARPRPGWPPSRLRYWGSSRRAITSWPPRRCSVHAAYVVEDFLPRYGISSTLVDGTDLAQWKNAVRPNTKTFFLESPTNPTLEIVDIAEVAKIAHAAGATLVVDNVFATPLFQSPFAARRRLRGLFGDQAHRRPGTLLGGVILGSEKFIQDNVQP